ncbi:anaerobic ribonucleoside-triphosphate reductase activating protein [Candidatus Uhrbacteria bacterium]|nr:anaerobic ribonucleoside-triphosphate reductase activating protein [Candidatus Uhrbacteria bacterium]
MPKSGLKASGVQPFTLLDFPGKIACIFFLPGCNFRCGYCHNPEFVLPEQLAKTADSWIPEDALLSFLRQRRGLLEGVVISGGEPTIPPHLKAFIREIRRMGFRIKLDTNGSQPDILSTMLKEELLDYVAMDVKTSLQRYPELVGPCVKPEAILESVRLIRDNAPDYEFRTTLIPEMHDMPEWQGILDLIRGARRYTIQAFRPAVTLDPKFTAYTPPDRAYVARAAKVFQNEVKELIILN